MGLSIGIVSKMAFDSAYTQRGLRGPRSLAQDSNSGSQCSIFGLTSLAQDSDSGSQGSILGLASLVETAHTWMWCCSSVKTPSAATVVAVLLVFAAVLCLRVAATVHAEA